MLGPVTRGKGCRGGGECTPNVGFATRCYVQGTEFPTVPEERMGMAKALGRLFSTRGKNDGRCLTKQDI